MAPLVLALAVATSTSACDGLCADWRHEAHAWQRIAERRKQEIESFSPIKLDATWWIVGIGVVASFGAGYAIAASIR